MPAKHFAARDGKAALIFSPYKLKIRHCKGRAFIKRAVKVDNHPLTIDDILEKVCNHYGVSQQNVFSKSRKRNFVQVRQVSMYLAQKYTKMPAGRIGQLIGGRDHSTVIHSCNTIEQRLKVDHAFSAELSSIENSFMLKK